MDQEKNLALLLEQSIEASNRTTHAVRAFVRFLFIQLSAITLALIVNFVGEMTIQDALDCAAYGDDCGAQPFFTFIAVAIWISGVIYSSIEGWKELDKSDVPKLRILSNRSTSSSNSGAAAKASSTPLKWGDEQASNNATKSCRSCGQKISASAGDCYMCGKPA